MELSLTGNIKADTGSAISGVECGRITRVNEYIICDQAQLDRIIDVSMPNEYFGSRLENTLIICADVIISANFKLSANDSVEIAKHGKLTIAEQAQLDLSGSMRVQEGGSVIIDGKLVCSGSIAVAKGGSLIAAEEAEYINTGSEFYEQGSHVVWNNRYGVMNASNETRIMCCKKQRYSSEANADYITTNAGSLTCLNAGANAEPSAVILVRRGESATTPTARITVVTIAEVPTAIVEMISSSSLPDLTFAFSFALLSTLFVK